MDCRTLVGLAHSFGIERKMFDTLMALCRRAPYDIAASIIEFRGIDIIDVAYPLWQFMAMEIKLEGEYARYIFDFRVSSHIIHAVFGRFNGQTINWPRLFTEHDYYIDDDVVLAMDDETVSDAVAAYFNRPYDPMFNADFDCIMWSILNIISLSGFEFTHDIIGGRSDHIDRLLDLEYLIDEYDYPASDSLLDVAADYWRN